MYVCIILFLYVLWCYSTKWREEWGDIDPIDYWWFDCFSHLFITQKRLDI